MDEVEFYLEDLKSRFQIPKKQYYLSYSGGRDSHFLYWFIKEYLHDTDIEIVSINTRMEHQCISERMYANADTVLLPDMFPHEVKIQYGSPCFSKQKDALIDRYQRGWRSEALIRMINGQSTGDPTKKSLFGLSKYQRDLLLSGKLHRISPKCCEWLKKRPVHKYEKVSGKKPILGITPDEGFARKNRYTSCFNKKGQFVPLWDMPKGMMRAIEERYKIPLPYIYIYIERTGCMGCPYGNWNGECDKELAIVGDAQRRYITELFRESYDILGVNYKGEQLSLF